MSKNNKNNKKNTEAFTSSAIEKNYISIVFIVAIIALVLGMIGISHSNKNKDTISDNSISNNSVSDNFANAIAIADSHAYMEISLNVFTNPDVVTNPNGEQIYALYDFIKSRNEEDPSYYAFTSADGIEEYEYWNKPAGSDKYKVTIYDNLNKVWVDCNLTEAPLDFKIAEQLSHPENYTYQGEDTWMVEESVSYNCVVYSTTGTNNYYDEIQEALYFRKDTGALVGIITIGDTYTYSGTENLDMSVVESLSDNEVGLKEYLESAGVQQTVSRVVVMYSINYMEEPRSLFNIPDTTITEEEWDKLYGTETTSENAVSNNEVSSEN